MESRPSVADCVVSADGSAFCTVPVLALIQDRVGKREAGTHLCNWISRSGGVRSLTQISLPDTGPRTSCSAEVRSLTRIPLPDSGPVVDYMNIHDGPQAVLHVLDLALIHDLVGQLDA